MTTNVNGVQYPVEAFLKFGIANFGTGNGFDIPIPVGALLKSIVVLTQTAFDSATSAVLTVSDGTTTFVNAVDVKSAGSETVANTPKFFPSGGTLHVTGVQVGTATVGECEVTASYVKYGKANEVQF